MQFQQLHQHQIEVDSLDSGNLSSVQPTFRHLIDFVTVQHQVGCESVVLIKKDVRIRTLFEGERKMEDNQAKCEGAGRSNVCVSYHALSEDWSEIADRTINMLEKIIENEAVHAMLAVLTDKQRDLIHQQFVLGKTHQEIADDMGISRGSVTRAVNQALERIRRKFDFEAHYELAAGGLT